MINLFRIVVFLAALSFCFSLEQITEKHRNGMPHFVKTFSIVKDKLVLQKETEFDRSGQKVLEQTYSNGALVSKSKWDENGEKTIIRYKNKWTKKEISAFDDYECMEAEGQRCGCIRDIVLDNLSYEEYYLLVNLKGPDAPDIPQGLKKKVRSIRKKIKKECEDNSSASVLDAKNQIKNLHQSAQSYYTQYGSMPGDCYEEMESRGTIEMSQKVIDAWEFECDWEFEEFAKEIIGQITATSTESNDAGPGKQIIYDLFTGEYTGYGQGGK